MERSGFQYSSPQAFLRHLRRQRPSLNNRFHDPVDYRKIVRVRRQLTNGRRKSNRARNSLQDTFMRGACSLYHIDSLLMEWDKDRWWCDNRRTCMARRSLVRHRQLSVAKRSARDRLDCMTLSKSPETPKALDVYDISNYDENGEYKEDDGNADGNAYDKSDKDLLSRTGRGEKRRNTGSLFEPSYYSGLSSYSSPGETRSKKTNKSSIYKYKVPFSGQRSNPSFKSYGYLRLGSTNQKQAVKRVLDYLNVPNVNVKSSAKTDASRSNVPLSQSASQQSKLNVQACALAPAEKQAGDGDGPDVRDRREDANSADSDALQMGVDDLNIFSSISPCEARGRQGNSPSRLESTPEKSPINSVSRRGPAGSRVICNVEADMEGICELDGCGDGSSEFDRLLNSSPSTPRDRSKSLRRSPQTRNEFALLRVPQPHEIGFPNPLGTNTCWMNASLQVLMGMKSLIGDLQCTMTRGSQSPILRTLMEVIKLRNSGSILPLNKALGHLKHALGVLDTAFCSERQQDAPEFLVRLLDYLREEFYQLRSDKTQNSENGTLKESQLLNILTSPVSSDSTKSNPICNNIQFRLMESYSCTSCGAQSTTGQDYLLLYVDIPSESTTPVPSLQSALDQYMKTDTRERTCTSCSGQQCRVDTVFCQLPRNLVIQVKRYVCQQTVTQKLTTSVSIPTELSVCNFVDNKVEFPKEWSPASSLRSSPPGKEPLHSPDKENSRPEAEVLGSGVTGRYLYQLTGILSHRGDKPNSGHYVADVYNYDTHSWYLYDDNSVEKIVEDMIIHGTRQESGYLFIYTYRPLHDMLHPPRNTDD